jgi:catechol 2,3-dioxygenase-like lactoylglutathione lyase family enzyme
MIKGVHITFFTPKADALRKFFSDTLKFPCVDAGHGWLIFALPPADFGCHPAEPGEEAGPEMSFYCDDIHQTVSELKAGGIKFTSEVVDEGWGLSTTFAIPGGELQLYQPRYDKPKWVEPSGQKKAAGKKAGPKKSAGKKAVSRKSATKRPAR